MAEKGAEAKFVLGAENQISAPAEAGARSLERLKQTILESENAVKEFSAAQRRLKGSSDEVKNAKTELTAKINAARAAATAAQLALTKEGSSLEALARKAKAAAVSEAAAKVKSEALAATMTRLGGPVAAVRGQLATLRESLQGARSASGLTALAFTGLAASVAALVTASVAGAASLAKWVVSGANAARTANLMREAVTGSAVNAGNLGDQVDVLSKKVSTSKEALNEMALSLAKVRISGRAQVDTLNAVAQAADAMGDDVGNKLKELVTRSQLTQRMFVSPQELFGTGLEFKDVASELSKELKISMKDAQAALFSGHVKLDAGAKALRAAVEKRFGAINARKMLDLNTAATKFHERMRSLTSGVKLDPLLGAVGDLLGELDESTVTGRALKELITDFGNGAVRAFKDAIPYTKKFVQGVVIGALETEIAYLKVRNALNKTFGDQKLLGGVDTLQLALSAGKVAAHGLAGSLLVTYATIRALAGGVDATIGAFKRIPSVVDEVRDSIVNGWEDAGAKIIEGLLAGMLPGGPGGKAVVGAVKGLARKAKDTFKAEMGIQSPSKVFAQYGEHTAEGFAQGVEGGSERASSATSAMVAPPRLLGGGSSSGRGPIALSLTIHVNVGSGGNAETGQNVAAALSQPSFIAQLTDAVEILMLGAGLPVSGGAA